MVNYQTLASRQGRIGEDIAAIRLEDAGFVIDELRAPFPGVEVDIIATNKNAISFYISVKASWRGDRQGLKRTDTLKKAICDAFMIQKNGFGPVLFITSHIPVMGRGVEMLKLLNRDDVFDVITLNNDSNRLYWLAKADEDDLKNDLRLNPNLWSLISSR